MEKVIALAGNPNVGKSTVFNAFTGMKQHTGNWPGKTVEVAQGAGRRENASLRWVDLPGCYSLLAHSEEEEVARDFICFEQPDAVVVVCDAACLERNLILALQVLETTNKAVVCVNLLDEARKKKINVDLEKLSGELSVPVVGAAARSGEGIEEIVKAVKTLSTEAHEEKEAVVYPAEIENAVRSLSSLASGLAKGRAPERWVALRLLEGDESFTSSMKNNWEYPPEAMEDMEEAVMKARAELAEQGYTRERIRDAIAEAFVRRSEEICEKAVIYGNDHYDKRDRRLDRLFTSRATGFPIMLLLLLLIFWLTICGANIPSALLADWLFGIQDKLSALAVACSVPERIYAPLIFGVYRVLAWVISVMLPPMAIFFPLFTLLEDFGYLPRVAYNLDRCFHKCRACGKQALTMCMEFEYLYAISCVALYLRPHHLWLSYL